MTPEQIFMLIALGGACVLFVLGIIIAGMD